METKLTGWAHQVWLDLKTNRPAAFAALEQAGTLRETCVTIQEAAKDQGAELTSRGLPYNQAMELVFNNLLRVPTEQEEPETPLRFRPPAISPSPALMI